MEDLYQELLDGGVSAVTRLVSERRQETVDLEFKTKKSSKHGGAETDDRRNLAIALSAFANSMGGLLVWGVEAKRNEDGIDCAQRLHPIQDIERFKSDVIRLLSHAITPKHEGILVEAIHSANARSGYLLVLVSRSERRPHRCEFGDKQYFKRIGDSSMPMEHYDIEDSFKRTVVPSLEVKRKLEQGMSMTSAQNRIMKELRITLSLHNDSATTARFPYVVIESVSEPFGLDYPSVAIMKILRDGKVAHFRGNADDVVHPELPLPFAQLTIRYETLAIPGHRFIVDKGVIKPILIRYRCGCLNARQFAGGLIIGEDEILAVDPSLEIRS